MERKSYAVTARTDGTMSADGTALDARPPWTPEHLVLAALARCTLASLAFHCERAGISLSGTAAADGAVDRTPDGRYAFVDVECGLDVSLEPAPEGDALGELLGRAERGCFVGASLTTKPRYEWRVNGALAEARPAG